MNAQRRAERAARVVVMSMAIMAVASLTVAAEIPEGYTPWFSVDGTFLPGAQTIQQPTETLVDWQAVQVIAVASNVTGESEPSEPSDETLIAPSGTVPPVQGWTGPVVVKGTSPLKVQFSQPSGGVPTRYTFYKLARNPIGACARPGKPEVVP